MIDNKNTYYGDGAVLSAGFDLHAATPLDYRTLFKDWSTSTLSSLSADPLYVGLIASDEAEKKVKILKNKPQNATTAADCGWQDVGATILEIAAELAIPKEQHKLIYTKPQSNKDVLVADYLCYEKEFYVVDNTEDFDACKAQSKETNILGSWDLYTSSTAYPEYSEGRSARLASRVPITRDDESDSSDSSEDYTQNSGIGYGGWGLYPEDHSRIINDINSYDYTGYVTTDRMSSFHFENTIGTDKGNTTGDVIGFSLVNDEHATPKSCKDRYGREYIRNSKYDRVITQGDDLWDSSEDEDDWLACAWVWEDGMSSSAYVFYTRRELVLPTNGEDPYYIDCNPLDIDSDSSSDSESDLDLSESYALYFIPDRTTANTRSTIINLNTTVEIVSFLPASGFIAYLDIVTNNSTSIQGTVPRNFFLHPHAIANDPDWTNGTIYVYARILEVSRIANLTGDLQSNRENYSFIFPLINGDKDYNGQSTSNETVEYFSDRLNPDKNGDLVTGLNAWYNQEFGYYFLNHVKYDSRYPDLGLGRALVQYNSNLNKATESLLGACYIKSDVKYANSELTVKFGDPYGQKTGDTSSYINCDSNLNPDSNAKSNGSKLILDFSGGNYYIKPYDGFDSSLCENLPNQVNGSYEYKFPDDIYVDDSGHEWRIWAELFNNAVKYSYTAYSYLNLDIRCDEVKVPRNTIINLDFNKYGVYKYNESESDYVLLPELPIDLFHGSRLSYNKITKKLWYSNGKHIYLVGLNDKVELTDTVILEHLPTVKNELIYSDDNETLTTKQFMYMEGLVVDNDDDYTNCTSMSSIETDILGAWQQFQIGDYSPEYGNGKYVPEGGNATGYGYWYTSSNGGVCNKINSADFNGYLFPEEKEFYEVESLFGANGEGSTTGDQIGFSIVNDSTAVPRHFSTNGGVYYRNTLFDVLSNDGDPSAASPTPNRPSESAWVNWDRINHTANVIYTNSPTGGTGDTTEAFPSSTVDVYTISDTRTSVSRHTKPSTPSSTETVVSNSGTKASGYISILTVIVTNSSGMEAMPNMLSSGYTGTIYVRETIYSYDSKKWYKKEFIDGQDTSRLTGNYWDKGGNLVRYYENLNINGGTSKAAVIKCKVSFSNGILSMQFGNPTAFASLNSATYNGSELRFNFRNHTYDFIPYTKDNNNESPATGVIAKYNIPLPMDRLVDSSNNTFDVVVDFWSAFTGKTKFMYNAYSYQNLYINCLNLLVDNVILYVDKTSPSYGVYRVNSTRTGYEKQFVNGIPENPITYFTGSREHYNSITKKLWYSDGTYIYQIATNNNSLAYYDVTTDSQSNDVLVTSDVKYKLITVNTSSVDLKIRKPNTAIGGCEVIYAIMNDSGGDLTINLPNSTSGTNYLWTGEDKSDSSDSDSDDQVLGYDITTSVHNMYGSNSITLGTGKIAEIVVTYWSNSMASFNAGIEG